MMDANNCVHGMICGLYVHDLCGLHLDKHYMLSKTSPTWQTLVETQLMRQHFKAVATPGWLAMSQLKQLINIILMPTLVTSKIEQGKDVEGTCTCLLLWYACWGWDCLGCIGGWLDGADYKANFLIACSQCNISRFVTGHEAETNHKWSWRSACFGCCVLTWQTLNSCAITIFRLTSGYSISNDMCYVAEKCWSRDSHCPTIAVF